MPDLPRSFQHLSFADGVRASTQRNPGKLALQHRDNKRTYAQLMERIDRVSNAIAGDLSLGPGDHGAIISKNCIDYLEIVIGAAQAGLALATVNPRLAPAEMVTICDDAEAKVIFADAESAEAIKDSSFETVKRVVVIGPELDDWLGKVSLPLKPVTVNEWDVFTIPYTSGTTGKPKGVLVPHRSRVLTLFAMAVEYGCYSPDDRFLAMAPLCHGAGMVYGLAPIFFGGFAEILDRFEPELFLKRLKAENITGYFAVPTHFHGIFSLEQSILEANRCESLHTIISNAAPLPQSSKEQIIDYFGPGMLHETYGSTEAGIVTNLRPPDQLRKQRCVGLPFPMTEVKLVDGDGNECAPDEVGELFSRSPFLFNGYWNRPEETEASYKDGWVTVEDLARRDEEGHIYIIDRKKDMVISGGINIYPREIEEVLFKHPAIADVAVTGVPDEKWGERLKAFVVAQPGNKLNKQEVIDFCKDKLSDYKVPKDVAFIDLLPRNVGGKVLKRELRDL